MNMTSAVSKVADLERSHVNPTKHKTVKQIQWSAVRRCCGQAFQRHRALLLGSAAGPRAHRVLRRRTEVDGSGPACAGTPPASAAAVTRYNAPCLHGTPWKKLQCYRRY